MNIIDKSISNKYCLIHSGKTSFALSLPGIPNHCRGYWSRDEWYNQADYMIMDDIPWKEFRQRGFPNPEDLLTGQKFICVSHQLSNKTTR